MGGVKSSLAEYIQESRDHLSNTRPFFESVAQDPTICSLQPFTLTQLNLPLCNHGQDRIHASLSSIGISVRLRGASGFTNAHHPHTF